MLKPQQCSCGIMLGLFFITHHSSGCSHLKASRVSKMLYCKTYNKKPCRDEPVGN
jgi:hypothetical protein